MNNEAIQNMKILLINPPLTQKELYSDYAIASAVLPPLGLCSIAAVLEKNNYEVNIIDGVAEKLNRAQLIKRIKELNPSIIGMTAMTLGYNRAVETARLIKQRLDKNITILLGGAHVSSIPRKVFEEQDYFDIGVIGEGEYTILEVVKHLKDNKKDLKDIKGIIYKENSKIIQTPRRELIENLDELPFPARHLLPDIRLYNCLLVTGQQPNFASLVSSRGCPYQCIYCDQNIFGHKWRSFSIEYIIKEIKELVNKYGVKTIQIEDDLFIVKRERVIQFCKLLKRKNIKIAWNLCLRVNLIKDGAMLKIMKDAGCEIVYLGLESGNQHVLDSIKKGFTLEQAEKAVKTIKKAKLKIHGSFMLGLPFDTKKTIEETIKFALKLPLDVVSFHLATPFPNTEFERIANQYGTVHTKDYSKYSSHPKQVVFTPYGIDGEYLLKKQKEAYRRFYFRPRIIFNKLKEINSWNKLKLYVKAALVISK